MDDRVAVYSASITWQLLLSIMTALHRQGVNALRSRGRRTYNAAMLSDTSPEIERLHIEKLRAATPAQRLQTTIGMSQMVIRMSRMAMIRLHPDWTEHQLASEYVRIHYGDDIAGLMRNGQESGQ